MNISVNSISLQQLDRYFENRSIEVNKFPKLIFNSVSEEKHLVKFPTKFVPSCERREAKGAPSTVIWEKKQPPKIFKNGRRKFFQRQKFFIFHSELNSNVNRPGPALPGTARP